MARQKCALIIKIAYYGSIKRRFEPLCASYPTTKGGSHTQKQKLSFISYRLNLSLPDRGKRC